MHRSFSRLTGWLVAAAAIVTPAVAQPTSIDHTPANGLPTSNLSPANPFGGATTQRSPATPREGEAVTIYFRVGCQFTYSNAAVYYTTDGSDPSGSFATVFGTTQLLNATFVANEFGGSCTRDWWRVTLPPSTRAYAQTIKYRVVAWSTSPAAQATGLVQSYTNKLAWPGQGSNFAGAEGVGYPPFHAWKEEGVVGNNWINSMIDQNGSIFDVYFPGAGGVQGVGTKNEGYSDGLDTFPAGLSPDRRGQMHLNQMLVGIRAGGVTSWLSNQNGTDFVDVQQQYLPRTQTIRTTSRLVRAGRNIDLVQLDFAPKGVAYPANDNRMILIKRLQLTNRNPTAETVNVYLYMDPALNGGDGFDAMFYDAARGAMVAYDNTQRVVTGTGAFFAGTEYNPTTFSGYDKNVSLYLAAAMKTLASPSAAGGTPASDSWRDTSGDNGQGWIGQQVTLPPNTTVAIDFAVVGGFDGFAGATGTYNVQIAPALDWFFGNNSSALQATTDAFWGNFLDQGVTVSIPDPRLQTLFERGLLGTMLHFDEKNGGLIAGFRNGAYPYVWPRDMAWAAVTLARTGHPDVVRAMTRYLRDITFRDFETWNPGNTPPFEAAGGSPFYGTRKGFWKQKYSTDGYVIWGAPQVDETAVIPWMVYYNYLVTGDASYLTEAQPGNPANTNYSMVKDAAIAMSQTSKNDGTRLNHRPSYPGASTFMMYSNNVWEDSYDTFIMSNANIVRGLRDAASIASILGQPADAADFTNRANGIKAGLDDKLFWNGENTDISLLGIVYPFYTHLPTDTRAVKIIDRINGVDTDRFGNTEPLVRFAGQYINNASDYVGLVDRYWGDSYWANGALGPTPAGPWFLSTLWYGAYYALRQDHTPGTGDIDNHLFRLNRTADHNGPIGFGAEQMAPSNSLLYPGQSDFTLQTAWPNAWESMSFYVDAMMLFLDYTPNAPGNTLAVEPKLPSSWPYMTFYNLEVGSSRVSIDVRNDAYGQVHTFTNTTGNPVNFSTVLRIPAGAQFCIVTVNGAPTPAAHDPVTGRVSVSGPLATGAGATTVVKAWRFSPADIADTSGSVFAPDGAVDNGDFSAFFTSFFAGCDSPGIPCAVADLAATDAAPGPDGNVDNGDFACFFSFFFNPCP